MHNEEVVDDQHSEEKQTNDKSTKNLVALQTLNTDYEQSIVDQYGGVVQKVVAEAAQKVVNNYATILAKAFEKLEELKKAYEAIKQDIVPVLNEDNQEVRPGGYSPAVQKQKKAAKDKWTQLDAAVMACINLQSAEKITAGKIADAYKKLDEKLR